MSAVNFQPGWRTANGENGRFVGKFNILLKLGTDYIRLTSSEKSIYGKFFKVIIAQWALNEAEKSQNNDLGILRSG